MDSIYSSVQKLIKYWLRRERWKNLFNSRNANISTNRALWRTHLANLLESTPAHVISILLLLMDLALTILELSSSLTPSCEQRKNKKVQEGWFHQVSLVILSLLSAKTVALVTGLGGSFFRKAGNVVDGVVVIGAVALEALLEGKGGGLLLLVSLWRIVRVIESAFELSGDAIEAQIEAVVSQFEVLKEENSRLMKMVADKEGVIEKLMQEIAKISQRKFDD